MEKVLQSIKGMLGLPEEYDHFDNDLVIFINSAFMNLYQLGVGPQDGYALKTKNETWNDIFGTLDKIESVKLYVYYKTRIGFDPPSNSFVIEAMKEQLKEIEWRLRLEVED